MAEFRTAYKELFSQHPDKAGEEATAKFQEITEAARKVFEFLTANPGLQPKTVDKKDILGDLVKSNNFVYNTSNVCFDLTTETAEAWQKEFERMLGDPKPLPNPGCGIQYKKESWSLDGVSSLSGRTFGTISISYWPSTLKVMLQGSTYMNFATFAIPCMAERLSKSSDGKKDALVVEETENYFDVVENADNTDMSGKILIEGFRRMENEVHALRNELVSKVDESFKNVEEKEHSALSDISKKLDNLENILQENKTEIGALSGKLTEIVEQNNIVKLDKSTIDVIATAVSDASSTKKTELDQITTTLEEIRTKVDGKRFDDVIKSNNEVLGKLDDVKDMTDTFAYGLNKLEKIFDKDVLKEVACNSAESSDALKIMNGHMKQMVSLLSNVGDLKQKAASPTNSQPSEQVAKPDPKPPSTDEASAKNDAKKSDDTNSKNDSKRVRKGKLFSSSVALGCDVKRLEYACV